MEKNLKKIFCFFLFVLIIFTCSSAFSEYTSQSHYRWRNDNGSEISATFAAPEDTPLPKINKDETKRLRFGMTSASSAFKREALLTMNFPEDYIDCGVIDNANGFAYFGTNTAPGEIIKIRLSDFSKVDAISLADYSNPGEYFLTSAVIDPIEGYAYFANNYGSSGLIFKIDINPSHTFRHVATLTLGSGENALKTAVIDTSGSTHYAYFGTNTTPGKVIKVNLSTFSKESAITFATGENQVSTSVIDAGNGFAYFGLNTNPAKVIKVDINPVNTFQKISTISVSSTLGFLSSAIDTIDGYAYFGEGQTWSKIVKVRLSDFTVSASSSASNIDGKMTTAAIDTSGLVHYAYFVGDRTTGGTRIVKFNLNSFTRAAVIDLTPDEDSAQSSVIDTSAGYLYLGMHTVPGKIAKINLASFIREGTLELPLGAGYFSSSIMDSTGTYAYFGSQDSPTRIVRVNLATLQKEGVILLNTGEDAPNTVVLDPGNKFAYFGTHTSPGRIVKIDLSNFQRIAAVTLNTGENYLDCAVIDTANGYAYFGAHISDFDPDPSKPGKIIKIDIDPNRSFARVDAIDFTGYPDESYFGAAVMDTNNGYAYFSTDIGPDNSNTNLGKIIKIDVNPSRSFARIGSITLPVGENFLRSAVIDRNNKYAYFANRNNTNNARIVKIDLENFERVNSIIVSTDLGTNFRTAFIDPINEYAYFSNYNYHSPTKIIKVNLPDFTIVETLNLENGEERSRSSIIDVRNGYAYVGFNTRPAKIVKMSISPHFKFSLEYGGKITTCSEITNWFSLPSEPLDEHWQIANSSFLTNYELTTNIPDGITDTNINFNPGQAMDAGNETGNISLSRYEFTEVEFSIKSTPNANSDCSYCFRLANNGSSGIEYLQYPEAYIPNQLPTVIDMASVTLKQRGKKVLIKWITASEIDNIGFNIYRSKTQDGDYIKLNRKVIPSKGNATMGAKYTFKDIDIESGRTYWYKIEDIDNKAGSTFHGPYEVKVKTTRKKNR
ncbi:MAG: hypothetical protein HZA77_01880 [Candidatus Schekmanbacteria bacterium]|nr:hypothetical protein [Candidatus Schekmanbacteria bacterium]